MTRKINNVACALVLLVYGVAAWAQESPASLIGCLDPNGSLFNVAPSGTPREQCPQGTIAVQLGSLSNINVGDSLISKIENGNAFLDINPGLAIPPSCPPGQIAVADGEGGWICTPPNLVGKSNPGSKVWVVPQLDRCVNSPDRDSRPTAFRFCGSSGSYSELAVVNPGTEAASVACYFFDHDGVFQLDLVQNLSLPPGGQRSCASPFLDNGSERYYAWALIVSSLDVLPTARTFWESFQGRKNAVHSAQIEAYPVDCDEPDGHEFVCAFAK